MADLRKALFLDTPRSPRLRPRTPALVEEDPDTELNFNTLDELLLSKVNSFQLQFEENTGKIKTSTISELVSSLQLGSKVVLAELRSALWAQLFKLTVFLPGNPEGEISEVNAELVVKQVQQSLAYSLSRAEEAMLAVRAAAALVCTDVSEVATQGTAELLPLLQREIGEYETKLASVRACCVEAILAVMLFVYHDAGVAIKALEGARVLMTLAEDLAVFQGLEKEVEHSTIITDDDNKQLQEELASRDETSVIAALFHAVGVLVTLVAEDAEAAELIEDLVPRALPFLEDHANVEVAKAAGRLIGVCYEVYPYEDDTEEDEVEGPEPYYDTSAVLAAANAWVEESSKKISRKDKKETHSVFRDVARTLENYLTPASRLETTRRLSGQAALIPEAKAQLPELAQVRVTKAKALTIHTWFTYLRYAAARWVFGAGVQTQMVGGNTDLKAIMKKQPPLQGDEGAKSYRDDAADEEEEEYADVAERGRVNKKKRDQQVNKERMEKAIAREQAA